MYVCVPLPVRQCMITRKSRGSGASGPLKQYYFFHSSMSNYIEIILKSSESINPFKNFLCWNFYFMMRIEGYFEIVKFSFYGPLASSIGVSEPS